MGDPDEEDSIGSLPDREAPRGEAQKERSAAPEPRTERPEIPAYELPDCLRGSPQQVLETLIRDDPFELRSRCFRVLRRASVCLSPERFLDYATSRIAVAAARYRGVEPIEAWLEECIEQAIDHMLADQREEERRGADPLRSKDAAYYRELAAFLGIPPADARMASVVLNGLDGALRDAFFAVVVDGVEVEDWAEESVQRPSEVHEQLRQVGMILTAKLVQRDKARRRRRKKL